MISRPLHYTAVITKEIVHGSNYTVLKLYNMIHYTVVITKEIASKFRRKPEIIMWIED